MHAHNSRKVVTYRFFTFSDARDTAGGHGTHVAGSIVGSAGGGATADQITFASQVRVRMVLLYMCVCMYAYVCV